MPRKHKKLRVVKVPLKKPPLDQLQIFPRLPRLYLELIENKAKIHQDLINREYVPPLEGVVRSIDQDKPLNSIPKEKSKTLFKDRLNMLLNDDDSYASPPPEKIASTPGSISSSVSSSISSVISDLSIEENIKKPNEDDGNDTDNSNLSQKLKALLGDDSVSSSDGGSSRHKGTSISPRSSVDKYHRHRDKHGYSVSPSGTIPAPTLAQLEARGGYIPRAEMRDLNQVNNNEQDEEDSKRELLFKFDLLRKSYPVSNIPDYTIHTDIDTLKKAYSDCVRRLSLDSSVESYKTYLVYGFMGVEFVLGNFLGFDMQGFTQQQIISMHSYEKLLIELGEKSYVPSGSKWPVELRLLFMIIMNAAFFVISKMMMKKTGANLMGMINSMNRPAVPSAASSRKRKMRGPTVDLGDIPAQE